MRTTHRLLSSPHSCMTEATMSPMLATAETITMGKAISRCSKCSNPTTITIIRMLHPATTPILIIIIILCLRTIRKGCQPTDLQHSNINSLSYRNQSSQCTCSKIMALKTKTMQIKGKINKCNNMATKM